MPIPCSAADSKRQKATWTTFSVNIDCLSYEVNRQSSVSDRSMTFAYEVYVYISGMSNKDSDNDTWKRFPTWKDVPRTGRGRGYDTGSRRTTSFKFILAVSSIFLLSSAGFRHIVRMWGRATLIIPEIDLSLFRALSLFYFCPRRNTFRRGL